MPEIAVHLHLYYTDMWEEISGYLRNLDGVPYDLYVTLSEENPKTENKIKTFNKNARIWITENRGYDIGPFTDFLHRINSDDYKYILKIHTKRCTRNSYCCFNRRRINMKLWKQMLFDALLYSPEAVRNNLLILEENPRIGLLGNAYTITDEPQFYKEVEPQMQTEMQRLCLPVPEDKHFLAGTMFLVRAELLKPFLKYQLTDFAPSDGKIHDNTLAHVVERLFSWAVTAQGYKVRGVLYRRYLYERSLACAKRFLFQKKRTRKGRTIIKVCKIPVYLGGIK